MNISMLICCYLPLIVVLLIWYMRKKRVNAVMKARIERKNKNEGVNEEMQKLIDLYMNQGVCITTIEETIYGRLTDFDEGWVTVEYKGKPKHLNTEFMVRIEPYTLPEDKKKEKEKRKKDKNQ